MILVDAIRWRARSFEPTARPRSSRTSPTSPVQVCSSTFTLKALRSSGIEPFSAFSHAK
jgi:hypothetical protein